ncbi:AAA family ATPase [Fibrobacter sp.]
MMNATVILKRILLENYKNVKKGEIPLVRKDESGACIAGIYGQNGSGKTAIIDALGLLKNCLRGDPLEPKVGNAFALSINIDSESARLEFEFAIENNDNETSYKVVYGFSIKKDNSDNSTKLVIYNEKLSYSSKGKDTATKFVDYIDTDSDTPFVPKAKYDSLIGKDKTKKTNLLVAKKMAEANIASFIFSKEMHEAILPGETRSILERLTQYAENELFVIRAAYSGRINLNEMPLYISIGQNENSRTVSLLIPLNNSGVVHSDILQNIKVAINSINIVLPQIIPYLKVGLKILGKELMPDGSMGHIVRLTSCKEGHEFPLAMESDGIKKIISILSLLINVYNNHSTTVAIDELDSGIFEYLLGEILRVISEKGKGQLLFTSHNLRPLETLDKNFIVFTTTNPMNRYIRFSGVKTTNNLRDFYYRDIILGEQSEPVYESTNNSEIALAFKLAGGSNAS